MRMMIMMIKISSTPSVCRQHLSLVILLRIAGAQALYHPESPARDLEITQVYVSCKQAYIVDTLW